VTRQTKMSRPRMPKIFFIRVNGLAESYQFRPNLQECVSVRVPIGGRMHADHVTAFLLSHFVAARMASCSLA
jgi:hypothetical protein